MSTLNRSSRPIEVPRLASTRLPKRSRIEDHPSNSSPIEQARRQIPLNAAFASSSSSDLATSKVAIQQCLQPTDSYFLAPGQPDMNSPFVLDLYTQLVKFQQDTNQPEIIFDGPDHVLQDLLHALARKLGLEFEYSLRYRRVCISKTSLFTKDLSVSARRDGLPEVPLVYEFSGNLELPSLEQMFVPDEMNFHMSDIFPGDFDFAGQSAFQPGLEVFDTSFVESSSRDGQDVATECLAVESVGGFIPFDMKDLCAEDGSASKSYTTVDPLSITGDPRMWQQVPIFQHEDNINFCFSSHERVKQKAQISQNYTFIQDSDSPSRLRTVDSASSNAVKAIGGACWKCKVLRKKCDTQTTCQGCVKGEKGSTWQELGCRRGSIETQFSSPYSCPKNGRRIRVATPSIECCESCERLRRELSVHDSIPSGKDEFPWTSCFRTLDRTASSQHILHFGSLEALCMGFAQEWSSYRGLMEKTLRYATLEFMQHCPSRTSPFQHHHECTPEHCIDTSAHELVLAYANLLEELSRILFQKKNLKGDKSWWLPVFISLCLLGFSSVSKAPHNTPALDHLHLTVRLFTCLSSNYDPLRQESRAPLTVSNIWLGKAVGFDEWEDRGIGSSAEFLRVLFGIGDVASESLAPTIVEGVQIDTLSTEPSWTARRDILPVCTRRYPRQRDPLKATRIISTANTENCDGLSERDSGIDVDCDAFQFSENVQAVFRELL